MTVTEQGPSRTALRRSPLADRTVQFRSSSGPLVRLWEETFSSLVDVRVHPGSSAVARIEQRLGRVFPRTPNTALGDVQDAVLWLGPDEWLIFAPDGRAAEIATAVRSACGDSGGSTVDLSAGRAVLRLAGPCAREVLESACSLDLHPRVFRMGRCTQTLLGRAGVILWQVTDEPGYRVVVACSFAGYVADLLLDGMRMATG